MQSMCTIAEPWDAPLPLSFVGEQQSQPVLLAVRGGGTILHIFNFMEGMFVPTCSRGQFKLSPLFLTTAPVRTA